MDSVVEGAAVIPGLNHPNDEDLSLGTPGCETWGTPAFSINDQRPWAVAGTVRRERKVARCWAELCSLRWLRADSGLPT